MSKPVTGLNKPLIYAGLAAAVVLGAGAWFMSTPQPATPIALQQGASTAQPANPVAGMVLGQMDAPVTIVEYASFTCPHCKAFHDTVLPQIKRDYIDTGKAKLEFREFYLNGFDVEAGKVAQCGGPMRYFGIVDLLFKEQGSWPAGGNQATAAANLMNIGKRAGMTDDQLKTCIGDEAHQTRMIETFQWHAANDQIQGTPTFLVNGVKHSNMPYAEFAKVLDAAHAKATQ